MVGKYNLYRDTIYRPMDVGRGSGSLWPTSQGASWNHGAGLLEGERLQIREPAARARPAVLEGGAG